MTSTKPPLWTKDFIFTALANLFLFFGFQMLIPTLPVFVEQQGGDDLAVGLVIGLFTVSALLIRPVTGYALDLMNRRIVLMVGLTVFLLSTVGYYGLTSVILILWVRFIHGIGWGIATTSLGTLIAEIIPAERRGEGMGYYGLSGNLAMALAPLFGLYIIDQYGFSLLFLFSGLCTVLAFLLSQGIHYKQPEKPETGKPAQWTQMLERKALFPSFLMLLFGVTYGGIVGFITLFGSEVGIRNVGWFFLGNALMIMAVRPVAGILFDRKGHGWVLFPGVVAALMGLVILSMAKDLVDLVLAAVLYGIGFGAIQPSLQAWTINRVPPFRKGAATGTFFSAFDLGIGGGAMVLGVVAQKTSYAQMYLVSSAFLLLFLVVYVLQVYRERKQQHQTS
jgi:MFS family permease